MIISLSSICLILFGKFERRFIIDFKKVFYENCSNIYKHLLVFRFNGVKHNMWTVFSLVQFLLPLHYTNNVFYRGNRFLPNTHKKNQTIIFNKWVNSSFFKRIIMIFRSKRMQWQQWRIVSSYHCFVCCPYFCRKCPKLPLLEKTKQYVYTMNPSKSR